MHLTIEQFLEKISHVDQQHVLQTLLCELRGQNSYHRFLGNPEKILYEVDSTEVYSTKVQSTESNELSEILKKIYYEINRIHNRFRKTLQLDAFNELLHTVLKYYCFDEKYAGLIEIGKIMRQQNYSKSAIIQIIKQKTRVQQDIHKIMCKIYEGTIYEGTTWPENSWEI